MKCSHRGSRPARRPAAAGAGWRHGPGQPHAARARAELGTFTRQPDGNRKVRYGVGNLW